METLKKRIFEGFDTQTQQTAAGIQDAQVGDIANETLMDRISLLAMAIVDPVLHPQFAALAAPVDVSARLDNNAKARKRVLYRTLAETVMYRRAQYANTFVDFAVDQFGCVVKDIRPEFGVFHATPTTCAGELFQALMIRMVNEYNEVLARLSQSKFNRGGLRKDWCTR